MSRETKSCTRSVERPRTNQDPKVLLLTVPEYKAFRDIPDESPESRSRPLKENRAGVPSPKPSQIGFSTPSENSIRQRYRGRTPSSGNTYVSGGRQFLFNTTNPSTPTKEALEFKSIKLQSPESMKPLPSMNFKLLSNQNDVSQDEDSSLVTENENLKKRVLDLSLSLLEENKSNGHDEFYIKTLMKQKNYFENEMKAAHAVINQKEKELKEVTDQFKRKVASLVNEVNIWKERAIAFERSASNAQFFEKERFDDWRRDSQLKDKEISYLTNELRLREQIAENKVKFLSKELERLQSLGEETEKASYERNTNEFVKGIERLYCNQQKSGKINPMNKKGIGNLGTAEEQASEDSASVGDAREIEANKVPIFDKSGANFEHMKQNTAKFDLFHVLFMIEIDRLHSIIDELAKVIKSTNSNFVISRD